MPVRAVATALIALIAGLCTALQLARRGRLSIMVLDQGRGRGEGSTGASSAVCRHRYTHPEMIRLARDAIDRYRGWQDFLGTRTGPRARLHATGVLWLSGEDQDWDGAEVARLVAHGVPSVLLDDSDLRVRFPALSTCILSPDFRTGAEHDCIGGGRHLFEETAGYMDAQDVLDDLVAALRSRGVEIRFGASAERILVSGPGQVSGVALADGTEISCGAAVNASGPWCNRLLAPLGLDARWPLVPTRIQVLHLPKPPEVRGELPVCVDFASGIYLRPDNRGQQLIVGSTLEEDEREEVEDPSDFERFPDEDFRVRQLHALHHRLPGLPYRGRVGGVLRALHGEPGGHASRRGRNLDRRVLRRERLQRARLQARTRGRLAGRPGDHRRAGTGRYGRARRVPGVGP